MAFANHWLACACISLFVCLSSATRRDKWNENFVLSLAEVKQINVDQYSSHESFTAIQSAIDSIPSNNSEWVVINVAPGIYREVVLIPADKPYIFLKGSSRETTQIVSDAHDDVSRSTFKLLAANFIAKGISFVNTYRPAEGVILQVDNGKSVAVAATISGDKSAFYECGFMSVQDTLFDDRGRHYFYKSYIEGQVDFIFGDGQSLYEKCLIKVVGDGYITAQGRTDPNSETGFVFKGCLVIGTGSTYLGRAWRRYARVIFYRSMLASVIAPQGWSAWNNQDHLEDITFVDYACRGEGAKTDNRVAWANKLDQATMQRLIGNDFIDSDRWLDGLPLN